MGGKFFKVNELIIHLARCSGLQAWLAKCPIKKKREDLISGVSIYSLYNLAFFQELQIYPRSIWITRGSGAPLWTAPGSSEPRRRRKSTCSSRCTSWRSPTTATSTSSKSLTRRRTLSTGKDTSVAPWPRPIRVKPMYCLSGKTNSLVNRNH